MRLKETPLVRALKRWTRSTIAYCPLQMPRFIEYVIQLSRLGSYTRSSGLQSVPYFSTRYELYDYVQSKHAKNCSIDYLEFGVFKGDSIRHWLSLDLHPESRFIGFDTFEGFPETWESATGTLGAGYFSTEGRPPHVQDSRCRFIKGIFQDTLKPFLREFRPERQLIVHCDADLYTSTLFVLTVLDDLLIPGSIVIFDEFGTSVNEEFRAFQDYIRTFRRNLVPIARSGGFYEQVVFLVETAPATS